MNLLFLSKRFPQGRDLLTRPYGRFYHLARILAERGHRVHMALLSYRGLPSEETSFDGIAWSSDDLWPSGPLSYLRRVNRVTDAMRPDWIMGFSDTYFGILARRLARRSGARCAIDAYDDFEAYIPWAAPLHSVWRNALANADLVTAAGPQLASLLEGRGARHPEVLPMAADPGFRMLDQTASRAALGLPMDRRLIGHIGAFDRRRGCQVVLDAFEEVRRARPDVSLVLSGRQSPAFHRPPGIYGLGYIPDDQLPALVNSLDVACVALADNDFGRSSYPVKLCEAIACQVPVVASSTPPTQWMLHQDDRFLADIGNAPSMAGRMLANLSLGRITHGALASWAEVGAKLATLLETAPGSGQTTVADRKTSRVH
jgi:glycosyltransferase involved in cell wall biosynthesis